nr:unnamed protein product [Callosobruchus analis]
MLLLRKKSLLLFFYYFLFQLHTVIGIYHSPNTSDTVFLDFLDGLLEELMSENKYDNIILLGDFNIDWRSEDTYSKRLKQSIAEFGLKQIVTTSTHVWSNGSSLIDLVITSSFDLEASVLDESSFSNHRIIQIKILNEIQDRKCIRRSKLSNISDINKKLQNFDYRDRQLNMKYISLCDEIRNIIDDFMPKNEISKDDYKSDSSANYDTAYLRSGLVKALRFAL